MQKRSRVRIYDKWNPRQHTVNIDRKDRENRRRHDEDDVGSLPKK
jgi:hypothetical protein